VNEGWRISIDTGGTFTDCLAIDPHGREHRVKVLSSSSLRASIRTIPDDRTVLLDATWTPGPFLRGMRIAPLGEPDQSSIIDGVAGEAITLRTPHSGAWRDGGVVSIFADEEAPLLAARMAMDLPFGGPFPLMELRLATTRCTNALLERRGADTAFFITEGFGDLLTIGDQTRPELFTLDIRRPPPLAAHVVEVSERLSHEGEVVRPLDESSLRDSAEAMFDAGIRTAAIALLHAPVNPAHEQYAASILREAGFVRVVASHELSKEVGILARAETSVVEGYLRPILREYLDRIEAGRGSACGSLVMTSAGGLLPARRVHATQCLLSGPAAGAVGAGAVGRGAGRAKVIGFDMGGTSTDVCRIDNGYAYVHQQRVGEARILETAIAIETVAAGGGSICEWRHGRLTVGPQSAGADPGPACYGRSGPLTLTDVNLLLGRIVPERFGIPIDRSASERALRRVLNTISNAGERVDADEVLEGFLRIADQRMADAIAQVSVRQGVDPGEFSLVSFGGAGGQHACRVAELLGINEIIMPRDASILSAVGLSGARIERIIELPVHLNGADFESAVPALQRTLKEETERAFAQDGLATENLVIRRVMARTRLLGQTASLDIDLDPERWIDLGDRFRRAYIMMYGYEAPDIAIEVVDLRAVVSHETADARVHDGREVATPHEPKSDGHIEIGSGGSRRAVPVYERDSLRNGASMHGPGIVLSDMSAYVIDSGWTARVDAAGSFVLTRDRAVRGKQSADERSAITVIERDLLRYRLESIAFEMGEMLQRTAISVNVKERRDFSCAILDGDGKLLINAPHMPVHLGALGLCVRTVREVIDMRPGDVIVTNHPAHGGSHLPDITVMTPVFSDGDLVGYLANRAHHAEIGGTRPGSMPPDAQTLAEEGVVIPPMHLVRKGHAQFEMIESLLRDSPWPSRMIEQNLADLRAQVAANRYGLSAIDRILAARGASRLKQGMAAIQEHARSLMARCLRNLKASQFSAEGQMDDGTPICVSVRIDPRHERVEIDFSGSGGRHPGNLNATPAIVRSAVLYVLRVLIGEAFPMAEGLMDHVTVTIPPGLLNPAFDDDPRRCPAVVGGNVETSQRVVDVLLIAFGLAAASQGTMNNLLFGDATSAYYETICGGSGAGPGFNGTDAVHSHMTNTRITDAEVLERSGRVRVERFAIRRGSGGAGAFRGGDGAVRELVFLRPAQLSILSQRRTTPPYGLAGGDAGAAGRQRMLRADRIVQEIGGIDGCDVRCGDRLIIETPGGGGFGRPSTSCAQKDANPSRNNT